MGHEILIYFGYPRAHEAERGANREAVSLLDEALQIDPAVYALLGQPQAFQFGRGTVGNLITPIDQTC